MEIELVSVAVSIATVMVSIWAWRLLNWVWLRPKRLERLLRQQGLNGNPYRLVFGDLKEHAQLANAANSTPIHLSDDILPRVSPLFHTALKNHGKNSFVWFGPTPRVTLINPELIKEIFYKNNDFKKINSNPLARFLVSGLVSHEGQKWAKHRKIINPAFHQEKLKQMQPAFYQSCKEMISKWEDLVSANGTCEIDVWPYLESLTSDVISRTAFGSNFEEGKRIFQVHNELANLTLQVLVSIYIPGWRFLPTKTNKKLKEIDKQIQESLQSIINKRLKAMESGEAATDDLLGILLDSNNREIEEHNNNKNVGMSIEDVIDECKLFYFAGHETTSALLAWTMVLLSKHQNWQVQAREEVMQVFGNNKPDYDGLNHLKIVSMILYEVLRLYPPVIGPARKIDKEIQLGELTLPAGTEVSLPIIYVHRDCDIWGDDALEFKPERFADGVSKATKDQVSFFPFGWGPRICVGQNFALLEAKMAVAMILQHFSIELSPSYVHAPLSVVSLYPQYGARLILRKV